jgi:O-methyltransferase
MTLCFRTKKHRTLTSTKSSALLSLINPALPLEGRVYYNHIVVMISRLLTQYPLISDQVDRQELGCILRELEGALDKKVAGDVVELGCYEGTTSLFIQRLLQARGETRTFHVYDSFAGLPAKTAKDASPAGMQFTAGELTASKRVFIKHFTRAQLPLPVIHRNWFNDLTAQDIPTSIAFAFLDGDFYESIRTSLHVIEKHLSPGAVIVVDDYQSEALPGAARAVNEWLERHTYHCRTEASLAIIHT